MCLLCVRFCVINVSLAFLFVCCVVVVLFALSGGVALSCDVLPVVCSDCVVWAAVSLVV